MNNFDRLCLFAHFDATKSVADHVIYYLTALRECGFSTVVISNCDLSEEAKKRLSTVAIDVIIRAGGGIDFASWAFALKQYHPSADGLLLLANDSVYGPVGDLEASIKELTSVPADIYGMVESYDVARHLQSWFLLIGPAVHQHEAFENFFTQDFAAMSIPEVIKNGEVAFSVMCQKIGMRLHALHRSRISGKLGKILAFNPMFTTWQEIICESNVPFIKVKLLKQNQWSVPHLNAWHSVVAQRSAALVPMIEAHLRRETGELPKSVIFNKLNKLFNKMSLSKACRFRKHRTAFHGFILKALFWHYLENTLKIHKVIRKKIRALATNKLTAK